MNYMQDIKDFHSRFGLLGPSKPTDISKEMADFRCGFMFEEFNETRNAMILGSEAGLGPEDILDGLVDLVYVALGTAYLYGFDFDEAWRRVHTANMQKIRAENKEDSKRGSTFDVVKPDGWKPPYLSDLVW